MGFEGFKGDFVGFFRGLEMDNSKPYFEAHRRQYEREIRGPMLALCEELSPGLGPVKVFRINRDIRFSADKSPYKTNIAAMVGPLYLDLSARHLFCGTGVYHADGAWLARYRAAVAGPAGGELERIVAEGRGSGIDYGTEDALRTAPRGYAADHPRIELLRWRNVVAGRLFPIEPWIATPSARDTVFEAWKAMEPFSRWLEANAPTA